MGRQLIEEDPGFRQTVEEVDALFRDAFSAHAEMRTPIVAQNPSVCEVLRGNASGNCLEFTEIAQPALFAFQVGLVQALRVRGATAQMVCGHSVGELAAAWAGEALTLAQAVEIVVVRSLQQARVKGTGQMTAVAWEGERIEHVLEGAPDPELSLAGPLQDGAPGPVHGLVVAGFNSPRSCTVAGPVASLAHLEAALAGQRIAFKRLRLDYAFHSPAMDPIRADLLKILSDERFRAHPDEASLAFFSTVSGGPFDARHLDGAYWWRNVREPVRMASAVAAMIDHGCRTFVEISPHPILAGYIEEAWEAKAFSGEFRVLGAIQRGKAGRLHLDEIAGRATTKVR